MPCDTGDVFWDAARPAARRLGGDMGKKSVKTPPVVHSAAEPQPVPQARPEVIVLDTQTLFTSHWPFKATQVRQIVSMATALGIATWVPAGVVEENEHQAEKALGEYRRTYGSVVNELRQFGASHLPTAAPEPGELLARWREAHDDLVRSLGIKLVPHTRRSVSVFFAAAVRRKAPFGDKGEGFRDAAIAASVIDEMEASNISRAWIVSANTKDFADVSWLNGEKTVACHTLGETHQHLGQYMAADKGADYVRALQALAQAIDQSRTGVLEFCKRHVRFSERDLGVHGLMRRFEISGIRPIESVFPAERFDLDHAIGETRAYVALVSLVIEVTVQVFEAPEPLRLATGQDLRSALEQQAIQKALADGAAAESEPALVSHELPVEVFVTGTLERGPDGYRDFRPTSATPLAHVNESLAKAMSPSIAR